MKNSWLRTEDLEALETMLLSTLRAADEPADSVFGRSDRGSEDDSSLETNQR